MVFALTGVPGAENPKTLYSGYFLAVPTDLCEYFEDQATEHVKGRIYATNQVLISLPSWDYTFYHNGDEFKAKVDSATQDGMDNARHNFFEHKEARRWKHLLLNFPQDHVLSSKLIYDDAGEDEELKPEIIDIVYSHSRLKTAGKQSSVAYGGFKVVRSDLKPTKKGKVENEREKKSKGASFLDSYS
jgi:hypothetical protein